MCACLYQHSYYTITPHYIISLQWWSSKTFIEWIRCFQRLPFPPPPSSSPPLLYTPLSDTGILPPILLKHLFLYFSKHVRTCSIDFWYLHNNTNFILYDFRQIAFPLKIKIIQFFFKTYSILFYFFSIFFNRWSRAARSLSPLSENTDAAREAIIPKVRKRLKK